MEQILKHYSFEHEWQYYDLMAATFSIGNKDEAIALFNSLTFQEQKQFIDWLTSGKDDEDGDHSPETYNFFLDELGNPSNYPFLRQLMELGMAARGKITEFMADKETLVVFDETKDDDIYDMPDFVDYSGKGIDEGWANITHLVKTGDVIQIHGRNKDWGTPAETTVHDLNTNDACELADHLLNLENN